MGLDLPCLLTLGEFELMVPPDLGWVWTYGAPLTWMSLDWKSLLSLDDRLQIAGFGKLATTAPTPST
eukprot:757619-Pelagomonas_calceolata.AAC.1